MLCYKTQCRVGSNEAFNSLPYISSLLAPVVHRVIVSGCVAEACVHASHELTVETSGSSKVASNQAGSHTRVRRQGKRSPSLSNPFQSLCSLFFFLFSYSTPRFRRTDSKLSLHFYPSASDKLPIQYQAFRHLVLYQAFQRWADTRKY